MALAPGARLGVYEITAQIGEGGMGEVYRATDTRLKRDVAIKVLLPEVAQNPERLARFDREAQILASLNHPNIGHIYGVEQAGETTALVLEYIDGPTLADRIAQGPLPLGEALPIARQIAEALEAAHEQGIIHRDLKPANIKVRPDGTVKVLDFGLAKAMEPVAATRSASVSNSPTITSPVLMTGVGVLLGTAAYMSPEQAKGAPADRRSDIWAFGCVLYEMLAGRPPFGGVSVTEVLAEVIKSEPDWSAVPAGVPPQMVRLLRRCLSKDLRGRWPHIGVIRLELSDTSQHSTAQVRSRRAWLPSVVWTVATVALMALAALAARSFGISTPSRVEMQTYRTSLLLPNGAVTPFVGPGSLPAQLLALSPDGRRLAFVAISPDGRRGVWIRTMDSGDAQPLPGTDNALHPFWSPDGAALAFFTADALKRIDLAGGPPVTICPIDGNAAGGTWSPSGDILFARVGAGGVIQRVPASGGKAVPATTLDEQAGETRHVAPSFLPDGRHFLYLSVAGSTARGRGSNVFVAELGSVARVRVMDEGGNAQYAAGRLWFVRQRALLAQPFSLDDFRVEGSATVVAGSLQASGPGGTAAFSVARNGTVAYRQADDERSTITRFYRNGGSPEALTDVGVYGDVELSPDGRRLAYTVTEPSTDTNDIWLMDLSSRLRTRLTFDPGSDQQPIWSPDSKEIVFNSNRSGAPGYAIFQKRADGTGDERLMRGEVASDFPESWSPDGRFIIYRVISAPRSKLMVWPLAPGGQPYPFPGSALNEQNGRFSPDGRWLAYVADESGRTEVYVTSFPTGEGKWQVSTAGGIYPRWRADGRELMFVAADGAIMGAELELSGQSFKVGAVRRVLDVHSRLGTRAPFDISPDGQQFIVNVPSTASNAQAFTLVVPGANPTQ